MRILDPSSRNHVETAHFSPSSPVVTPPNIFAYDPSPPAVGVDFVCSSPALGCGGEMKRVIWQIDGSVWFETGGDNARSQVGAHAKGFSYASDPRPSRSEILQAGHPEGGSHNIC